MTTSLAPPAVRSSVDGWARRFVDRSRLTQGLLAGDFDRFLAAHAVPAEAHEAVRERAQELLLGHAFTPPSWRGHPPTSLAPR
jgi:hypothetical protein